MTQLNFSNTLPSSTVVVCALAGKKMVRVLHGDVTTGVCVLATTGKCNSLIQQQ